MAGSHTLLQWSHRQTSVCPGWRLLKAIDVFMNITQANDLFKYFMRNSINVWWRISCDVHILFKKNNSLSQWLWWRSVRPSAAPGVLLLLHRSLTEKSNYVSPGAGGPIPPIKQKDRRCSLEAALPLCLSVSVDHQCGPLWRLLIWLWLTINLLIRNGLLPQCCILLHLSLFHELKWAISTCGPLVGPLWPSWCSGFVWLGAEAPTPTCCIWLIIWDLKGTPEERDGQPCFRKHSVTPTTLPWGCFRCILAVCFAPGRKKPKWMKFYLHTFPELLGKVPSWQ